MAVENRVTVVFLDRASLPVPLRPLGFPHIWQEYDATTPEQILVRAADAQIILTNKISLDAATLAALPHLRLIAVAATGVNIIDLAAAKSHGIAVCNIRGYAIHAVPEHAVMLLLALARNLPAYQSDVAQGAWHTSPHFCHFGAPIRDLHGRMLTLIGRGSLGRRTAALAEAFGMRTQFAEHKNAATIRAGYVPFRDALASADAISLHCPLTPATRGLIGAEELAWLKPDALLVNTARGGLVDEVALLQALQAGQLGGAALDVLEVEPPSRESSLLSAQLPNLIITPHVGWASHDAMTRLAEQLVANCEAFVAGTPQNLC